MTAADPESSPDGTITFAVAGRPVRVRLSGPEDGSPVLLLHGIARSLEDWTESHDLLAAAGYRVISADTPGFGFTAAQRGRPGMRTFARAMAGLLDAVGVEGPVHVMGNSLGGGIAMTLAVEHPGRVASLVLVDSIGFGTEVNLSPLPMVYATAAGLPVVGRRFVPLARAASVKIAQDQFFDPSFATPEMLKHYARVGRQPDFRRTFLGAALSLAVPMTGRHPRWRDTLHTGVRELGIPVLVVWGDADTVLPAASHFEAARRALPDAQTHLFEDTGHMPQIEKAAEFAALAGAFLAEVDAVADGRAASDANR